MRFILLTVKLVVVAAVIVVVVVVDVATMRNLERLPGKTFGHLKKYQRSTYFICHILFATFYLPHFM